MVLVLDLLTIPEQTSEQSPRWSPLRTEHLWTEHETDENKGIKTKATGLNTIANRASHCCPPIRLAFLSFVTSSSGGILSPDALKQNAFKNPSLPQRNGDTAVTSNLPPRAAQILLDLRVLLRRSKSTKNRFQYSQ
jgi:hypothetical protein